MATHDRPKILVLSSLYPNAAQPRHGIFVEERLRHLLSTRAVEARVVAPVPWFPFTHSSFGRYAQFARAPRSESRHGIDILHPRYPVIPRVGMTVAPALMASALTPVLRRMLNQGYDFDLIDAHYFYPDGVAAAALGQRFRKPVTITARGTDINLITQYRAPRRQILWAANRAAALITVSGALKDGLIQLGEPEVKVTVLRNGVDLERFAPMAIDKARLRLDLPVEKPIWLSAGHLIERKGHHIAIEALAEVPDALLLIVGDGPLEQSLRQLAKRVGVTGRVRFLGHVEHDDLAVYYAAADALVLASASEGMPNVMLEAMACGTPVIATSVGGIPEILRPPKGGELMTERSPNTMVEAWKRIRSRGLSRGRRDAVRHYVEAFSWAETSKGQLEVFSRILGRDMEAVQPQQEDAPLSGRHGSSTRQLNG